MLVARRYHATWFRKYNFLLSAALDGGTQIMIFVYTFAVGGGSGKTTPFPTWALVRSLSIVSLQVLMDATEPDGQPGLLQAADVVTDVWRPLRSCWSSVSDWDLFLFQSGPCCIHSCCITEITLVRASMTEVSAYTRVPPRDRAPISTGAYAFSCSPVFPAFCSHAPRTGFAPLRSGGRTRIFDCL